MYQHLDDPAPFVADRVFEAGVVARGRRLRRRRRLAAAATVLCSTVVGLAVGGVVYIDRREAAIERVDIVEQPEADGATNILLVGVDTVDYDGGAERARSDAMTIVRLRDEGGIGILGLPRDVLDADGRRLGQVFATDGIDGLTRAIDVTTGIPIHHVVVLDYRGFVAIVDQVGGLQLAVDAPMHDSASGLALEPSECATLDGEQALALVRARRLEGDPTSDLGRVSRQGAILGALLARLATIDDPFEIDRLSRTIADHATVDSRLDVLGMGRRVADVASQGTTIYTTPVVAADNGVDVVIAPEAAAVFAEFGGPAPPTGTPTPSASPPPDAVVPIRPCG